MSGRKICSDCNQRYGLVITWSEDRNSTCDECAEIRRSNLEQIAMTEREERETKLQLALDLERRKTEIAEQAAIDEAEFTKMKAKEDAEHARQIDLKQEERKQIEIDTKAKIEKERTKQAEEKRKETEAKELTKREEERTKQMKVKNEMLSQCSNMMKCMAEAKILDKKFANNLITQVLGASPPATRSESVPTTPKPIPQLLTVPKIKQKCAEKSMKKTQLNKGNVNSNKPQCK